MGKPRWHEIFQLGDPIRQKEPRNQDVGRRPIELLVPDTVGVGGNLESAPFFVIEDRSKDAGRVEVWVAVPVDRTVHAHQRNCAHVADDSVIFDRLIRHCSISFLFVSVFFAELTSFAKRMRYKQFAVLNYQIFVSRRLDRACS